MKTIIWLACALSLASCRSGPETRPVAGSEPTPALAEFDYRCPDGKIFRLVTPGHASRRCSPTDQGALCEDLDGNRAEALCKNPSACGPVRGAGQCHVRTNQS